MLMEDTLKNLLDFCIDLDGIFNFIKLCKSRELEDNKIFLQFSRVHPEAAAVAKIHWALKNVVLDNGKRISSNFFLTTTQKPKQLKKNKHSLKEHYWLFEMITIIYWQSTFLCAILPCVAAEKTKGTTYAIEYEKRHSGNK